MRFILIGGTVTIFLASTGCGEGSAFDNGIRDGFRRTAVESCISSSRGTPMPAGFNWERLCGCAIDRYMEGKSGADLRSADPSDPALRAATQQCAMEQMGAAQGAAATGSKPTQ
ncbi:MAG TPA: hypothetical protein VEW04_11170 [Allosphingosinicella sp.]|nr:hypothetical protein [Allosphingosinicella sp.]